jgi:hypothetical protein
MDQMLADANVVVIASAVTPWKRACAGQRSLKIFESFQSAASGADAVVDEIDDPPTRLLWVEALGGT